MISVIISSANAQLLADVSANIAATIGVPFELLAFDNTGGKEGICAVYNRGARRANYPVLCFLHEDIALKTPGWGRVLLGIFEQNPDAGLVGVAGSSYKSMAPSSWWHIHKHVNSEYIHLIQGQRGNRAKMEHQYTWPQDTPYPRVAAIDGVWMATKKDIAMAHAFDEQLLRGFHGYDLDFSLNVGQHYHVVVTRDILLEHFSEGHYSAGWLADTLALHRKWVDRLPIDFTGLDEKTRYDSEKAAFKHMLRVAAGYGYSRVRMLRLVLCFRPLYRRFGYRLFFSLFFFLLKIKRIK